MYTPTISKQGVMGDVKRLLRFHQFTNGRHTEYTTGHSHAEETIEGVDSLTGSCFM